MLKIISFILFACFIPKISYAEIKIKEYNGTIYVENATTQELEDLFSKHKYKRFRALDNDSYPAIFVI